MATDFLYNLAQELSDWANKPEQKKRLSVQFKYQPETTSQDPLQYKPGLQIRIEVDPVIVDLLLFILDKYNIDDVYLDGMIKTEIKKRPHFDEVWSVLKKYNNNLKDTDLMYNNQTLGGLKNLYFEYVVTSSDRVIIGLYPDEHRFTDYRSAVDEIKKSFESYKILHRYTLHYLVKKHEKWLKEGKIIGFTISRATDQTRDDFRPLLYDHDKNIDYWFDNETKNPQFITYDSIEELSSVPEVYIIAEEDFIKSIIMILNLHNIRYRIDNQSDVVKTVIRKRPYFGEIFSILQKDNPHLQEADLLYTSNKEINTLYYEEAKINTKMLFLGFRLIPDQPDELGFYNYEAAINAISKL